MTYILVIGGGPTLFHATMGAPRTHEDLLECELPTRQEAAWGSGKLGRNTSILGTNLYILTVMFQTVMLPLAMPTSNYISNLILPATAQLFFQL